MALPNKRLASFPLKLYYLLEEAETNDHGHIVSWSSDGKSFKVHDKEQFQEKILPLHFSTSNHRSFQRNLQLWGFRLIANGKRRGSRFHPKFVRGDMNSIRQIEYQKALELRTKGKKIGSKSPQMMPPRAVKKETGVVKSHTGTAMSPPGLAFARKVGVHLGLSRRILLQTKRKNRTPTLQMPALSKGGSISSFLSSATQKKRGAYGDAYADASWQTPLLKSLPTTTLQQAKKPVISYSKTGIGRSKKTSKARENSSIPLDADLLYSQARTSMVLGARAMEEASVLLQMAAHGRAEEVANLAWL